jgi:predicted nucleotidyltransferase
MKIDPRLYHIVAAQPYPLLFATISGAHLYGFPSPDSDFDLRGAHVLPLEKVVGLDASDETLEDSRIIDGLDMDIVSHDVKKFFGMLLKKNGYVLEQVFSPLVVHTTPEHEELKAICGGSAMGQQRRQEKFVLNPDPSPGLRPPSPTPVGEGHGVAPPCSLSASSSRPSPPLRGGEGDGNGVVTKHHAHHYFGFAETQWKLFMKGSGEQPAVRRVKPLLYVYRVLLTGIHLMRTGVVEANLLTLNESSKLPYIADLVARKLAGPEDLAVGHLSDSEVAFHEGEYQRLRGELESAHQASQLPEVPSEGTRKALEDLLVRIRLKGSNVAGE